MAILVIAEHDNASLSRRHRSTRSTAAAKIGGDVHVLVAGKGADAAAEAAAQIAGVRKVLLAEGDALGQRLAETVAALVVALAGGYDAHRRPGHRDRQERPAARRGAARRRAGLRDRRGRGADTFMRPIYAGNALADGAVDATPTRSSPCAPTGFDAAAGEGGARRSKPSRPAADRACRRFVGEELSQVRPAGADLGARSSSPAAAALGLGGELQRDASSRSPTSSAPRSAPRAPRSTPATRRTTSRSARPARSSRPTSTSPSASRARSSTSPG